MIIQMARKAKPRLLYLVKISGKTMSKRESDFKITNRDQFERLRKELDSASERACAIVGAALLDHNLADLLLSFMIDAKETKKLLRDPDGPLGSLGNKTNIAYSLGLLTSTEYDNLKLIGNIRNAFAHQIDLASFEDQWITQKCNLLMSSDSNGELNIPLSPRNIYVDTVFDIAIALVKKKIDILEDGKPEKRVVP